MRASSFSTILLSSTFEEFASIRTEVELRVVLFLENNQPHQRVLASFTPLIQQRFSRPTRTIFNLFRKTARCVPFFFFFGYQENSSVLQMSETARAYLVSTSKKLFAFIMKIQGE